MPGGVPYEAPGPGGRARICWSCCCAAICCATSAVWMPWKSPSSQPTSWAWAIRSSASLGSPSRKGRAIRSSSATSSGARPSLSSSMERWCTSARRRRPASSRGALRTSSSSCLIIDPMRMTLAGSSTRSAGLVRSRSRRSSRPSGWGPAPSGRSSPWASATPMPSGVTTTMRGSSRWESESESESVSVPWPCRLASSLMRSILPHRAGRAVGARASPVRSHGPLLVLAADAGQCEQVVVADVAHGLVHVGHLLLHLGRHVLLLALTGICLGAERHRLREPAIGVDRDGAAEDVGPLRVEGVHRHVAHHPELLLVADAPLDDLDELRVVRPAVEHHRHVVTVVEGDAAVEALLGVGPPGALLGAFAVAHRRLARVEADDADELVVVVDAVRAAEPAGRAWLELFAPGVHASVEHV